ncbi:uncharacterized protein [Physcomitrium patens]|nr:uncharacterized protein LOC112281957 isoform X2 [Physcomitrium patens]|eukprot:XP_024374801.1 uncharacterized protein LOC112281957 isoform X2 [Physcomitrella patens]
MTVRLRRLAKVHATEGAEDTIDGDVVTDTFVLGTMLFYHQCATAAYELKEVLKPMLLDPKEEMFLLKLTPDAGFAKPSYFVAVVHSRRLVVLSIRGSFEAADLLTDFVPDTEAFQDGIACKGMLDSARHLLNKEASFLRHLLTERFPGYKLVMVGHSLGGAVVSLLTMLVCGDPTILGIPLTAVECWGYGCAPCVDRGLAIHPRYKNIHNVVLQDDIVPRLHPNNIERLHSEIQNVSENQHSRDGTVKEVAKRFGRILEKTFDKAISVTAGGLIRELARRNAVAAERPDLVVPGKLYHIKRNKLREEERGPVSLPEPCQPFSLWEGVQGDIFKYKHHVIRGTNPSQRFGRIIVSLKSGMDHLYNSYRDALVDAKVRS